ncbi:MAG: DUF4258 domain-containing protein [Candidatus Methylomirabilis oxygeniifera]|nr:MAG: DUF4258 domain-containing protein [Candidatus Methylomirabilis oxyfera]
MANYDGDSSYGDWEFNANDPPTPDNLRSYEPGLAMKDPWDESSGIESSGIEYYHADLIGTTRGTTNHLGAPAIGASGSPVTYTAFGERLDSDDHLRYGYAGSWGYQAHDVPNGDPVQFLHVGWRYYDPRTGRFLQKDPMGIGGGWNVYQYSSGRPTTTTDANGLKDHDTVTIEIWVRSLRESGKSHEEAMDEIVSAHFDAFVTACSCLVGGGSARAGAKAWPYASRYLPLRYSGHAVTRMMERGLTHSVVQNAVRHGARFAGKHPGTVKWCYENVHAVVNYANKVVTVIKKGH